MMKISKLAFVFSLATSLVAPSVFATAENVSRLTKAGGGNGDPHFKTFSGHLYDFHGECDLVLLHSKSFNDGLGLDVHVRTKIKDDWSYITGAAVKIGEDTFQAESFGRYALNGVKSADLLDETAALSGFPVIPGINNGKKVIDGKKHGMKQFEFVVDLREKGKIIFKVSGTYMAVLVKAANGAGFDDAVGLMGEFETGSMIGRDGKTSYEKDPDLFGLEWQVTNMDPTLFNEAKGPQFPALCKMPPPISEKRRRLESTISFEDAAKACANWPDAERANCINDVQMTGELDMALAIAF